MICSVLLVELLKAFQIKDTVVRRLGLADSACVCSVSKMVVKSWHKLCLMKQDRDQIQNYSLLFPLGIHV